MKIKVTSFSMVNFSDGYNIALKDGKHGGLYINWPKNVKKSLLLNVNNLNRTNQSEIT